MNRATTIFASMAASAAVAAGINMGGWTIERHLPVNAPAGVIWVENTSTGVALRAESAAGTALETFGDSTLNGELCRTTSSSKQRFCLNEGGSHAVPDLRVSSAGLIASAASSVQIARGRAHCAGHGHPGNRWVEASLPHHCQAPSRTNAPQVDGSPSPSFSIRFFFSMSSCAPRRASSVVSPSSHRRS